jgi:hypothetical protein
LRDHLFWQQNVVDAFHCRPLRHYFHFSRPFSILCRLNVCSQYSVHQVLLQSRFEINKARNKLHGHDPDSDLRHAPLINVTHIKTCTVNKCHTHKDMHL